MRPPTKAAVSSSVQTNSSTISMTSIGIVAAAPRSAMRKIGILSLRERMKCRKLRAPAWLSSSSPRLQSTSMTWKAESADAAEMPSSAEVASTTSMARACSS
jgi:hypothetical protein